MRHSAQALWKGELRAVMVQRGREGFQRQEIRDSGAADLQMVTEVKESW